MKGKTAILSDADSALAFRAAGVDAYGATPETAADALKKLARGYRVIFVTEELYEGLTTLVRRYDSAPYPIVLPLPSGAGSKGLGMKGLKESGERALGADILFQKEEK